MTAECRWIQSRFEDFVSDDPEIGRDIESHLEACTDCQQAVEEEYAEVDRAVAAYFNRRMAQAESQMKRSFSRGPLAAALAGLAAVLAVVWLSVGSDETEPQIGVVEGTPGFVEDSDIRSEAPGISDPLRAKPAPGDTLAGSILTPVASTEPPTEEKRFYVMDAAGYFHTLSDFSGSVILLAVFDGNGTGTEAFEKLYLIYGSSTDVRLLAVALEPDVLPPANFPFLINGGSSLLETEAGDFAIVTRTGMVDQRGSLEDEALEGVIRSSLQQLGVTLPSE